MMPPCLLEKDSTLKEWAWPTSEENYFNLFTRIAM